MAKKPFQYAWLEAVAQEMRKDPKMGVIMQLNVKVATLPTGEVIDLAKEFGDATTTQRCIAAPIDEDLNVYGGIGASLAGSKMVVEYPSMTPLFPAECIFEQCSKLRAMTGGQASMPIVMISDGASRKGGSAQQHTDVGTEAVWAFMPGITVVAPTNSYDAKGLMTSALHLGGPVIYMNYGEAGSTAPVEVPDDQYEVPIGKAAVRQEGKDLTLVAWAPATIDAEVAVANLKKAGVTVEYIDLRTIKPLDTETLFASVKKTGRLLVVEHGPYGGFSSYVVSEVAQFVPGAKVRRITFPDAPGPNPGEMILWMRPDAPKIEDAVLKFLKI